MQRPQLKISSLRKWLISLLSELRRRSKTKKSLPRRSRRDVQKWRIGVKTKQKFFRFKPGLHRVAEHACDDASKRILKLALLSYRLQIFLVRDQYLRSLLQYGDETTGALNEKLLETSYNEVEIYQDLGIELACHCITAFPGKLKGVLHSQEDDTNIFPSQLHNMSELCAFHQEHP